MKPINQIIESLKQEPQMWTQGAHTLRHINGVEIWTANLPFFNVGIWRPLRVINFIDKIRLQLAIYRWHKNPIIIDKPAPKESMK